MYSQEVYKICGELKVRPEVAADILCIRMHQKPEVSVPKRTICGCSRYKAMHDHSEGCPDWQKPPIMFENGLLENILPKGVDDTIRAKPHQCECGLFTCKKHKIQAGQFYTEYHGVSWPNSPQLKEACPIEKLAAIEDFKYSDSFNKEKSPVYENQKLTILLAEIVKFTEEYRLVRNKEYMRLKVLEELGEYSVATLGDKVVTETPRQELVDLIITTFALFVLEGGNLNFFADYGMVKLEKAKEKINKLLGPILILLGQQHD